MRAKVNWYLIFILLIIFGVFEYGIQKLCGFTLYPDEFGYWASAADVVGYDWSEMASMGSYYSFGYSLILIPVLKVFTNGITVYRAAIFVNMLMMCGSVFLFWQIIGKMFPETETGKKALFSGIAALYPAWIFYMQMTMAEAVLFFIFVLDSYLFLSFMEKQKIGTAIGLAAALIYGYCVHMRTVGVVIACVITLACWCLWGTGKKRALLICLGVLILLGVFAMWFKNRTIAEVFSHATQEMLSANDYSGQWNKFTKILTLSGMRQLMDGIVGKLYYLGISSFGTFYWALGWCMKESARLIKNKIKKKDIQPRQWFSLFLLLAVTGQVLISSIYMYNANVIDCLVYGRYNELFVPVMMLIGIVVMFRSRFLIPVTMVMGTALGGVTLLLLDVIEQRNMSGIRGYHIPGISYLLQEEDVNVFFYFRDTWLLGFGLMLFVCVLVWLSRWRTSVWWVLTGILIIEIAAGLQISSHYTYKVNNTNFENRVAAEALQENVTKKTDIIYLDEGYPQYVDFLQMQIPANPIRVVKEDALEAVDCSKSMIITYVETKQDEILQEMFDKKITAHSFCLYYN